jgi:ankyrin repeat protein
MQKVNSRFNQIPKQLAWSLVVCCILALGGLAQRFTRPAPDAAQKVLKLRGYEFDGKAFLTAVQATDQLAITSFLDAGMDVNTRDEMSGQTALILASSRGALETAKTLLQGRADPNLKDKSGSTALFRALQNRHDEVGDLLLAQPSLDLNARGLNGVSVLIAYVARSRADIVAKLLERGVAVNLQDADGDTPLHIAAQVGNLEVLQLLLAKGANVNAKNNVGGTPLMWAAVYDHEAVTRALIDHGADVSAKDEDGVTAAEWAAKNKRASIVQLLRDVERQ